MKKIIVSILALFLYSNNANAVDSNICEMSQVVVNAFYLVPVNAIGVDVDVTDAEFLDFYFFTSADRTHLGEHLIKSRSRLGRERIINKMHSFFDGLEIGDEGRHNDFLQASQEIFEVCPV